MVRRTADPMDALELLGNEIRIVILRELAEANRPLSFTELRERTGVRDSGKFNYHLTKLCGYFVRDEPEGYELGHAGTRVIEATGVREADGGSTRGASGGDAAAGEATRQEGGATEPAECPVCGAEDCEKLFHVHLTPPWR